MSWKSDRDYGEQFMPLVTVIADAVYEEYRKKYGFKKASYKLDVKQATDLFMMKGPNSLGVRIRRPRFLGWNDFTIRYARDSGAETEYSKVMRGFMDWFFYGWANSKQELARWLILDMDVFRAHVVERGFHALLADKTFEVRDNDDGTYLLGCLPNRFNPTFIVARSDGSGRPLPKPALSLSDACRTCGVSLAWPLAVGVIYADGSAECMACLDREVGEA